jgi:hypothetical protein
MSLSTERGNQGERLSKESIGFGAETHGWILVFGERVRVNGLKKKIFFSQCSLF